MTVNLVYPTYLVNTQSEDFFRQVKLEPPTLGKRILQARLDLSSRRGRSVSQTEIAGEMGVSSVTVSRWESDSKEPSLATITHLASVLNVSPAYLAFGIESYPLKAAEPGAAYGVPIVGTANGHEKKRKGGK